MAKDDARPIISTICGDFMFGTHKETQTAPLDSNLCCLQPVCMFANELSRLDLNHDVIMRSASE
jgi:hypothetical protein